MYFICRQSRHHRFAQSFITSKHWYTNFIVSTIWIISYSPKLALLWFKTQRKFEFVRDLRLVMRVLQGLKTYVRKYMHIYLNRNTNRIYLHNGKAFARKRYFMQTPSLSTHELSVSSTRVWVPRRRISHIYPCWLNTNRFVCPSTLSYAKFNAKSYYAFLY